MGEDKSLRVQFFLFSPISISHGTTWVEHLIDTHSRALSTDYCTGAKGWPVIVIQINRFL